MNINEYYRPKISKGIEAAATDYYNKINQGNSWNANLLLNNTLKKYGWTYTTQGLYSSVYVNPNKNYVLKLNKHPDPGYAKYVTLIKNYKNPHFPIISDLKQININNKIYYVYLIEKLKQYSDNNVVKAIKYVSTFPSLPLREIYREEEIPTILLTHPKLEKALRIVGRNLGPRMSLDLHSGNIMQRNDGTIVITDPYSSYF
jgi:hypothetical protein